MTKISVAELSKDLRDAIQGLESTKGLEKVGVVTRVGDGVAWVYGLRDASYNEVLQIETAGGVVEAFALNLMEDEIGAVILGSDSQVAAGNTVKLKGVLLAVPVGPELLGRVIDPLGRPLDGGEAIKTKHTGLVERDDYLGRVGDHFGLFLGLRSGVRFQRIGEYDV